MTFKAKMFGPLIVIAALSISACAPQDQGSAAPTLDEVLLPPAGSEADTPVPPLMTVVGVETATVTATQATQAGNLVGEGCPTPTAVVAGVAAEEQGSVTSGESAVEPGLPEPIDPTDPDDVPSAEELNDMLDEVNRGGPDLGAEGQAPVVGPAAGTGSDIVSGAAGGSVVGAESPPTPTPCP